MNKTFLTVAITTFILVSSIADAESTVPAKSGLENKTASTSAEVDEKAGEEDEKRDLQFSIKAIGGQDNKPSLLGFTESLRVRLNNDGTWRIDPRLLTGGFMAETSSGVLVRLFIEIEKGDAEQPNIILKWETAPDAAFSSLGSIVFSESTTTEISSKYDNEVFCLKSYKAINYTNLSVKELVAFVDVLDADVAIDSVLVSGTGLAHGDFVSLPLPFMGPFKSCEHLKFNLRISKCVFRNGLPCHNAIVTNNNGTRKWEQ